MISTDEDALICDLAETYQIYDYRQLPLTKVAVFSCGLREDSRIKMKMSNQSAPLNTVLLAGMSDQLSIMNWKNSKDGQKGTSRPTSILEILFSKNKPKEMSVFESGEDFEKTRQKLLNQGGEK